MDPAASLALLRGSVPTLPQVIVAIISFLETMLLIYLSYKVSAPGLALPRRAPPLTPSASPLP